MFCCGWLVSKSCNFFLMPSDMKWSLAGLCQCRWQVWDSSRIRILVPQSFFSLNLIASARHSFLELGMHILLHWPPNSHLLYDWKCMHIIYWLTLHLKPLKSIPFEMIWKNSLIIYRQYCTQQVGTNSTGRSSSSIWIWEWHLLNIQLSYSWTIDTGTAFIIIG